VLPDTEFARITLSNGTTFPLLASLRGNVMEVNMKLVANPKLMLGETDEAYLAILKVRRCVLFLPFYCNDVNAPHDLAKGRAPY
jgi:hypothetical protein